MEESADSGSKFSRRQLIRGAAMGGTVLSLTLGATVPAYARGTRASGESESLPTGRQFEIRRGNMQAIITEEGAGLRSLRVGGREFLDTYPENKPVDSSRGQVLIPWPNRIDHGQYVFNGVTEQLPLNEPTKDNAIHGLTRWMNWSVLDQDASHITLGLVLHAQDGYPFVLSLTEKYALTSRGLEVWTTAQNIGATAAPYGDGHHPYLTVGTEFINSATLRIPANKYFRTSDRLIPILPAVSVSGTRFDFRKAHTIGNVVMDTGFADLIRDADGFARVIFSAPGGHPSITVFQDSTLPFLQIYTGDTLPVVSARRRGLAVEAYSCASNAFNNGLGLRVLQPGQSFTTHWGISVKL